jgi:serine/threonine protein kinase
MATARLIFLALSVCVSFAFSETAIDTSVDQSAPRGGTHPYTPILSPSEAAESAELAAHWPEELPPGFKKIRQIGKGSYGSAFLVQEESTGSLRVMKVSHRNTESNSQLFAREQGLTNRARSVGESPVVLYRNPGTGQSVISMDPVFSGPGERSLAWPLSEIISSHMSDNVEKLPYRYRITPENLALWNQAIDAELARLHQLGVNHNDMHLDNILMGKDEQGRPVAKVIDFGLSSTDADKSHPMGASLYQSYAKLSGKEFDPKESDRYSARVVKAFLYSAAHGEKPSVDVQVPGGKTVPFPASVAAVVKGELKEFVVPAAKPIPPKPLSARQQQMLCEAKYADLWTPTPAPKPVLREVANVGR